MICRDLDVDRALASRQRQRALIEGRAPRVNDFIINSFAGAGGGAESDPFFSSVVLLMHFDNTLLDSSNQNATFTASGNATVSTTSPIMGTGSLLLDGTTDSISTPDRSAYWFVAAPFTIEWKHRFNGSPVAYDTVIGQHQNVSNLWKCDMGAGGAQPRLVGVSSGIIQCEYYPTTPITFTSGADYAMAWVRDGTSVYLFVNGVSQPLTASVPIAGNTFPDVAAGLAIGYDPLNSGRDINGRIDEVRLTAGVARYTANYTPASTPFPDF